MVVLAASLCTASGKVLVSRQFVEVPKSRIEGLLAAFPKLTSTNSQHTIIETETIRYVYQPIDNLFLILLTNKQSNILQDIETLRLFARVINKICSSLDDQKVIDHGFELLSAMDEVVSLGYRDAVTLGQVENTVRMESHEEKIQEIIAKNKEKEAKELMKEKIKLMDEQKRRDAMSGFSRPNPNASTFSSSSAYRNTPLPASSSESKAGYEPIKPKNIGGGMKLGSKTKVNPTLSSLQVDLSQPEVLESSQDESLDQEPVHFKLEERVIAQLNRDGGVDSLDLRGELSIQIQDEQFNQAKAQLVLDDENGIQFMTNPKMDKAEFNNSKQLQLKDGSRGFPVRQSVGILKWKSSNQSSLTLPFSVNCWISEANGGMSDIDVVVNLDNEEYEFDQLTVTIAIPEGSDHEVTDHFGQVEYQEADGLLLWHLADLNFEHREGTLQLQCSGQNLAESLFPISVQFQCPRSLTNIEIQGVTSSDDSQEYSYSQSAVAFSDEVLVA